MKALKRMKAKDYFESDLQARFADAVARGEEKQMRELLKQGADVNAVGRQEMRPLFWALSKQSVIGFGFLLENGADPNVQTKSLSGDTTPPSVMEAAALMENTEYLRLALKHGGNANFSAGIGKDTVIYEAILNHRIGNVRTLIKAGADMNHRNFSGITPMMKAASIDQYDIVHLLLEAGADPTIKNRWNNDLGWMVTNYGDRMIKPKSEQHEWYLKVVKELKRRGLMD